MITYNKTIEVWTYNLPAGRTCPASSAWCMENCYGRKGRFRFNKVNKIQLQHVEQTKQEDFVRKIAAEIQRVHLFRFHSSGDFYSVPYLEKAVDIAKKCPSTCFCIYTKTWRLNGRYNEALMKLGSLENVHLFASCDPSTEDVPGSWPFRIAYSGQNGHESLPCPKILEHSTCNVCRYCYKPGGHVYFPKH